MRLRCWMVAAVALASVSVAPALASAADEEARSRARTLVYQGDDLYVAGRYGEALEAYAEADALVGAPTTRVEVAKVLAALGSFVEARRIAAELVASKPPDEPLPFVEARGRAAGLMRDLDRRTPRLRIETEHESSFDVRIDGRGISEEEAKAGIYLDPGTHTVVVSADGQSNESRRVYLREGERRKLVVDLGPREIPISRWAIASFVLSGVALTAATVTGATSLARDSGEDLDELEAASVVSLAVAVGAGATGGIIIALDQRDEAERSVPEMQVGLGRLGFTW
ncbi:MAG: hypothetical protein HOV80_17475 [Polyangiaceae bacterium]|nr:hypothetical protein [Polyangiaceae bacterium]